MEFCKRRYRGENKVVNLDIKAAIGRVKEARLQVRIIRIDRSLSSKWLRWLFMSPRSQHEGDPLEKTTPTNSLVNQFNGIGSHVILSNLAY